MMIEGLLLTHNGHSAFPIADFNMKLMVKNFLYIPPSEENFTSTHT